MNSNISEIKTIFNKMENDGWSTKERLKWGHFFLGNKKNLDEILKILIDEDYQKESLHRTTLFKWILQLSKTEILDAEKLHNRNLIFNKLAGENNCIYDGWDVGKPQ